ncbi:MAG: bifunctional phosphoribosyl-AMP cyclohydrolase/phosphoribosyl-ATP diphosphatase HisIE [Polyangiales bacterium]
MSVKWDAQGLCVAVAQDRLTGRVQMVAWMNREALQKTLDSRKATFFSRSRNKLWTKGEESGHVLSVSDVRIDCDGDTILVLVDPHGPSCHTGKDTCFFRDASGEDASIGEPLLEELGREIESRKSSDAGKSYTKSLLEGGAPKIGGKLREEADELARALEGESDARVASEAADVLYHLMVGLASRGVPFREVLAELARRRGTSGHDEKKRRT